MAEGSKWTPGKIFLLIAGILGGLALLCCGAGWLLFGDKVMATFKFGQDTTRFVERLQGDFGTAAFDFEQNDRGEMVLAVGVKDELTEERVAEVQDTVWRAVSECFGKNGFLPVKHVAVGRPGAAKGKHSTVLEWSAHSVTVEELAQRTGVPAPPLVKFLPEDFEAEHSGVKIDMKGGGEEDGGDEGK